MCQWAPQPIISLTGTAHEVLHKGNLRCLCDSDGKAPGTILGNNRRERSGVPSRLWYVAEEQGETIMDDERPDYFAPALSPEDAVLRRIKGNVRRQFVSKSLLTEELDIYSRAVASTQCIRRAKKFLDI